MEIFLVLIFVGVLWFLTKLIYQSNSNAFSNSKYRNDLEKQRRENWTELVTRNKEMHLKKFPHLKEDIEWAYQYVYDKDVLPSMRSMQFGGKPIEVSPNRIFNCAFCPIDDPRVFGEIMFLLLGGTGVGYSVQRHHVGKLPAVNQPYSKRTRRHLIGDSIEGWADCIKMLMKAYFLGKPKPDFDFSGVRPKGALLVTSGGKAPGPEPLRDCVHNITRIFNRKQNGDQLTTLEVHDIICWIADAVLSGGIRRSATISLFSLDDKEMLQSKFGNWWESKEYQKTKEKKNVTLPEPKMGNGGTKPVSNYKLQESKKFTVAPAYNKGAYQVITKSNVKDIGR